MLNYLKPRRDERKKGRKKWGEEGGEREEGREGKGWKSCFK